jgi:hypothetical protein
VCNSGGDEATADLLDALPNAIVFTAGDNAYENGSLSDFSACYEPSWGRHKARTRPSVGNHEYQTPGAAGYFAYFGAAAGDPAQGYYAYDAGTWRIIVLNSNCTIVSCATGSPQEQWLRSELLANAARNVLAIWHHPRFTCSNVHGSDARVQPFWDALHQYGADLVVNGHDHNYQRYAPQNAAGTGDATYGIRQFIVGTGGRSTYAICPIANREVGNDTTFGVLKLTLRADSYDWEFIPVAGAVFTDSGSAATHGPPPPPR